MNNTKTYNELLSETEHLRIQLEEANHTIDAIRTGQVDALVVKDENGHQLFTLKTADQTYRVFIEKMNEGAVTLNRTGIILYSNSCFADMVGVPLEKVIGSYFETFIPEELKDKFRLLIESGWRAESKDETLLINRAKGYISCLLSCNTLELDEGLALSIILTDLTAQKENQQQLKIQNEQLEEAQNLSRKLNNELEEIVRERTNALQISKEHFILLADHIPQMTWTNLPSGEMTFFNKRWYDYTGLTFEETKGWGWKALIHPDDLQVTLENYNLALSTGSIFEVQNRYKRSIDGTYRWHLNRAIPLKNEKDEIDFWVGTATDIEEQKRAMEKKDEFIGIASHELKTPLTSLKGYMQIIGTYKKEIVPVAVKEYVKKANAAINKLQHLVNDLLDVSKIQAGRLDYKMVPFNLSEQIQSWVENSQHIYNDYTFERNIGENLLIEGNVERLEQVFMNLIDNAVKYSHSNKKIIIHASRSKNQVQVSVTDFGIGLTEEQKELIFERFYRVEDKKFLTSGLGMGLYICSEIIKAHFGSLGVDSQPGKGSTFYFKLPC